MYTICLDVSVGLLEAQSVCRKPTVLLFLYKQVVDGLQRLTFHLSSPHKCIYV